jgi:hypothetical protein
MSRIFARSPFYVTITGVADDETSLELRIWNGTGSAPTDATYTLSKNIPSTLITACNYNISPYIREYIVHTSFANVFTAGVATPNNEWCNVQVKKFLNGVLDTTTTYKAYDGWTPYESGYNTDLGFSLLDEGTYYYYYDPTAVLASEPLKRYGSFTFEATSGWKVKYTKLKTAGSSTVTLSTTRVQDQPRVLGLTDYLEEGNKVEILNASDVVQKTYYFRPIEECKYEPVTVDYINKYGAWSRTFMFKASREFMDAQNTEYHLMQLVDYDEGKGQFGVFNANGKKYITTNTGWVDEEYSNTIQELILSERILVNGKPAKMRTKSTQLFQHITEKLINYQLEFDYSSYIANNV